MIAAVQSRPRTLPPMLPMCVATPAGMWLSFCRQQQAQLQAIADLRNTVSAFDDETLFCALDRSFQLMAYEMDASVETLRTRGGLLRLGGLKGGAA